MYSSSNIFPMQFERGIWRVLLTGICFIAISESAVTNIPSPKMVGVNYPIRLEWNSNVTILEAIWGIRKGSTASADPQYIFVDNSEVPVPNPSLDANLRNRINYIGNLTAGQAWFNISAATLDDSNTYIALIREKGSFTQDPYYVQVIAIDYCAPNPCKNDGTCAGLVNGFNCTCAPGWEGQNCTEDIDDCVPNPCKNGGICTDLVNGYICTCPTGWTGPTCATNIDDCVPNPCKNGGTCNDFVNGFNCTCASGYGGQDCSQYVVVGLTGGEIAGIVIGIVVLLVIIVAIVVIVKKKMAKKNLTGEENKMQDKPSSSTEKC